MSQQNQNQYLNTIDKKIYVGGLPWETRNERLKNFFEQFGEIIHVNIVCDRQTNRSKGYGFVTFKDSESATSACVNRNPTIDGRIANCKLASGGYNNHNQPNQTVYSHDDLCWLSPSFWQSLQPFSALHQPLKIFGGHYWNQYNQPYYPQYDPQYYWQFYYG